MKRDLNILIVEDVPADVRLIENALRRGGLAFQTRQVETRQQYTLQLRNQPPDVILSDHGFPAFDGYTALSIAKSQFPNIPFIFVTGALGEEVAIQAFEKGASDYVLKHHLENLVPAVVRALKASEERRKRDEVEAERKKLMLDMLAAMQKTKTLRGLLPICASCKKIRSEQGEWTSVEAFLTRHLEVTFTHGLCPECADTLYPGMSSKPFKPAAP
ncbi:MAG: response regulator [Verrucomicrobia bacterium]|nr:response regulator [Verrucomicrobiota bacterium]